MGTACPPGLCALSDEPALAARRSTPSLHPITCWPRLLPPLQAYTILGHLAIFTDALKLGNKTYYQAAADCLLAELKRPAPPKSSPLQALFSRCKIMRAQGDPYPAHTIEVRGA